MNIKKVKKLFSRFWYIVWKDDSLKGWLLSILFIFVMIKFIFFPVMSLVTGTQLPLAIVESCSMYHDGNLLSNYNDWWDLHETKYSKFDITKEQFRDFIFHKGFNKGDILFILGAKPEKLEMGDVIIFNAQQRNPIIHRIIRIKQEGDNYIFSTIGDNNNGQLVFENSISANQIVGKAVFKLAPYAGWGKLVFYEWQKPESERGACYQN